ncbi:FG-GAP-like repeat-containing protein [Streptomyces sp. NPDC014861]|uniref:FG-GAP-like repeat-containing protein n=1 Tax=Streptomyces sp. NPDC014861 TaxID=3364923 RepID=UPI0036F8E8E3
MQFRSTGTRLASAVTAVLAVTALGAGTLATAPAAFAATSGTVTASQQADEALPVVPEGLRLSGVGASGFHTSAAVDGGGHTLIWTPFDGGPSTRIAVPEGSSWDLGPDDLLVLGDNRWSAGFGKLTLRDMSAPGTPDVTLDLTALNGTYVAAVSRDSVLAELKRPGGERELHLVTKAGTTTSTRKVTGLPDGAAFFSGSAFRDSSGSLAVGYEHGSSGLRSNSRSVIDPVTATVTETYPASTLSYGRRGPDLSDSHLAWFRWDESLGGVIETADRATGKGEQVVLDDRSGEQNFTLAGEWLVHGRPGAPATALSLTSGRTVTLLDSVSSATTAADGGLVLHGARAADGRGLFRVALAADGTPAVTRIAEEGKLADLQILGVRIPDSVDLDRTGGEVTLAWDLSHRDAYIDVTLHHTVTEETFHTRVQAPASGTAFSFTWDGTLDDGTDAPNGRYAIEAEAHRIDGTSEPDHQGWELRVSRTANPHDFTYNGSTDVLARDAAGVLWRDDLRDRPVNGLVESAKRTRIGGGWNTYRQIEAVGDIGGNEIGDLVALDGSGVLWSYAGEGYGTFGTRVRVGGGWGVYQQLTGGSDLDGDGRSDLVATDGAGVLWFYKGTGDLAKPFGARVRVGGGWGVHNELAAVGNVAGTAAGDLVARDTTGVLWLYQGDGKGKFLPRVKVGGGWNAFSRLVGAGDVDGDGRPDLIAYGAGGTYVYASTGSTTSPFSRRNTTLYAGEGSKFTSVA